MGKSLCNAQFIYKLNTFVRKWNYYCFNWIPSIVSSKVVIDSRAIHTHISFKFSFFFLLSTSSTSSKCFSHFTEMLTMIIFSRFVLDCLFTIDPTTIFHLYFLTQTFYRNSFFPYNFRNSYNVFFTSNAIFVAIQILIHNSIFWWLTKIYENAHGILLINEKIGFSYILRPNGNLVNDDEIPKTTEIFFLLKHFRPRAERFLWHFLIRNFVLFSMPSMSSNPNGSIKLNNRFFRPVATSPSFNIFKN